MLEEWECRVGVEFRKFANRVAAKQFREDDDDDDEGGRRMKR